MNNGTPPQLSEPEMLKQLPTEQLVTIMQQQRVMEQQQAIEQLRC